MINQMNNNALFQNNPQNPQYVPGASNLYQPNPYQSLNAYNQNRLPNLNYSLPGQNPYQNFGNNSFQGMSQGAGINPFDPKVNFLRSNNSMMNQQNFMQNTQNMANVMQEPELEINQYIAERMLERDKMKQQTEEINKRLDEDEEDELEKMEKKELMKEKEDDKKKEGTKDQREERQKRRELLFGEILKAPFDIFVPKSEFFSSIDRSFLEEIIMIPLKTEGASGRKYVTDYNKENLFDDKEAFNPQDIIKLNDEDEYFERAIKDGIYLDYVKQLLYSYNIEKIEQRAFREKKKDWFRPNGDIRMDNDIFNDVITKPIDISLSSNDQFNTFVGNSMFSGRNNSKMNIFKLKIIIGKIIFNCHPCFSEEDIIAHEVIKLHKDFYETMNNLHIPYLKEKIKSITIKLDSYNNIHEKTDLQETEIKNMNIFLTQAAQLLREEKQIINNKANALYNKWLDLKTIRRTQGYQNTTLKLNIIRFNSNNSNPNIFDYAFIITNPELENVQSTPKDEINRRNKIKNYLIFIKVYINNVFAFQTKPCELQWPSYEVEINSQFIMNLFTRPTKFEVELYINKKIVKKFEAEPPGMFSKSVTSSSSLFEEIEFGEKDNISENEIKTEEKNEKVENKNLEDSEKVKLLNEKVNNENDEKIKVLNIENQKNGKIEGTILLKTEWEGRAPDLPPTKIEDKLELINKQIEFKKLIRIENEDDYPFDVNDPRNVAFVEKMKKDKLELTLKFLYKEYLLTYYDVHSNRHYLLLKRLEKNSLNKLHFPILESQILKNKELSKILNDLRLSETKSILSIDDEKELKIREALDNLKKKYKGKILSEEEFLTYQKEKISAMKKDEIIKGTLGYFQVISEAEIYDNPILFFKEFFMRVFSRSRKLAPLRLKPAPVKVENLEKIKINIHVVKGYNIPLRLSAAPQAVIDNQKLLAVNANVSVLRDVFLADNQRLNQLRGNQNIQEMAGFNNIINNSGLFSGNINNNSINFDLSNSRRGNNPNFDNPMFNPINPNMSNNYYYQNNNRITTTETANNIHNLNRIEENRVNSFIEVRFSHNNKEGIFRTDSIESIHPDYNHQFEFYIYPKDNEKYFTREELSKCPDEFFFTLYDEVKSDFSINDKVNDIYVQKKERKYLGSFKVPLSTVFQNNSVLDTICKVDIPKTVFGYYSDTTSIYNLGETDEEEKNENENDNRNEAMNNAAGIGVLPRFGQNVSTKDLYVKRIINPFVNTYVSLYITLDPIPNFTQNEDNDYVAGYEDSVFLINSTKWLNNIKEIKYLKNRKIRLFAENIDGLSVFMPRYLIKDGQRPPDLIYDESNENCISKVSRFVSLIPFIEENQTVDFAEDMPDCWCTDTEFLNLGFGDYEEHAVLLCNYFNYVDLKQKNNCVSYLLIGDAQPEGSTIYVVRMTDDYKEVELWNAKTGDCFYFDKTIIVTKLACIPVSQQYKYTKSNSDKICPLKSVGAIVTFDNVYVNMQEESDPGLISFDLSNKTFWRPFLSEDISKKYFPEGIKTVQKQIEYSEPNENEAYQLKNAIRDYLKKCIQEERLKTNGPTDRPLKTEGLHKINPKIEKILEKYEMFSFTTNISGINMNKEFKNNALDDVAITKMKKNKLENVRNEQLKNLELFEKQIKDEFNGDEEVYGFPINLSYTTMKEIWEQIKLTNVHLIAGEDKELSLSVYVDPLPSGINSIWIFFAILGRRGL